MKRGSISSTLRADEHRGHPDAPGSPGRGRALATAALARPLRRRLLFGVCAPRRAGRRRGVLVWSATKSCTAPARRSPSSASASSSTRPGSRTSKNSAPARCSSGPRSAPSSRCCSARRSRSRSGSSSACWRRQGCGASSRPLVEMLAAIPSVILGFWGLIDPGPLRPRTHRAVPARHARLHPALRRPRRRPARASSPRA